MRYFYSRLGIEVAAKRKKEKKMMTASRGVKRSPFFRNNHSKNKKKFSLSSFSIDVTEKKFYESIEIEASRIVSLK